MYAFSASRPWLYLAGLFGNWRECVTGIWHLLSLCFKDIGRRREALIVEFNPFHAETLPGFVRYFQDLGYEVTVLTRYVSYSDSPFVRMQVKPRHFCLSLWGMRHFLKSAKACQFDFILYNSAHLYLKEYRFYGRVDTFLGGKIIGGLKGFALIEHSLKPGTDLEYFHKLPDDAPAKQNLFHHSFVLTPQVVEGHFIPMLNPCFFGRIKKEHRLNQKRIFITVGNVASNSRNFQQLFDALTHLDDEKSFEVWIIGKVLDELLVNTIPSNVKVFGRLTFAQMYNCLEQADFFLPLLDPQTQSQYLQGCTSGSRQLILGFCIPPIIHEAFAEHYGFNVYSCLTYTDDTSFTNALRQALTMSDDEYAAKKITLDGIAHEVYRESLENLRKPLKA